MAERRRRGRILRVDLGARSCGVEEIPSSWTRSVVGGRAANSRRLLEELDPELDPLSPGCPLIFGIGPLTGTLLPASAYFTVTARSPLTGILGDSAAGGQFGAELAQTGFDQIVVTGRAERLSYLVVGDDGAEILECPDLEGRDVVETTEAIRARHRDHGIEVAAVGEAGEHRVLFASIVSSGNRVSGRTGMGAVMGSKRLKALAVRGHTPVAVADPPRFLEEATTLRRAIRDHGEYGKRHDLGTTMLMSDLHGIGILPTRHFQSGVCDYLDAISGERLARDHKVKNKGCFNCNVHCSRYTVTETCEAEGPEFETLCSFTSRIGCDDLPFAVEMNRQLNQLGMDSLSTAEVIGWLMECREQGLVTPADLAGLDLAWGDTDAVRRLVGMIARREGIGDALADGATRFSARFSEEVRELVMQVKGLDVICGDPRGIKAYGLTYAVASRGADHLRAVPYFDPPGQRELARELYGTSSAADRLAEEGKAALVTRSERIALVTDSLTMCKNIGLCMGILDFENTAALLRHGTGVDYSAAEVESAMADGVDREHELNRRLGVRPEDDTLPRRFREEPLDEGPSAGSTVDIERMVDEYRDLHGRGRGEGEGS
jgi:aldehyde:ferredoxin oxidoreductase